MEATRNRWGCLAWSHPDPTDARPPVLDDLQRTAQGSFDPLAHFATVSTIRPDMLQAGQLALQGSQQQLGAVPIGHISGVHHGANDQTLGVDQQVALAAIDFLAAVIAAGATHQSRFD